MLVVTGNQGTAALPALVDHMELLLASQKYASYSFQPSVYASGLWLRLLGLAVSTVSNRPFDNPVEAVV